MNLTSIWRRAAPSGPLAAISLGVIVSYTGATLLAWLLLQLL